MLRLSRGKALRYPQKSTSVRIARMNFAPLWAQDAHVNAPMARRASVAAAEVGGLHRRVVLQLGGVAVH
jgi:hypothetical protein